MKKFIKRALAAALAVLLLLLSGCSALKSIAGTRPSGREQKVQEAITQVLSQLESKYGEKFEYIEDYYGVKHEDYIYIYVGCASFPGEKMLAGVRYGADGGGDLFCDNCAAFYNRSELRALMQQTAESVYGECKVCYNVGAFMLDPKYGKSSTAAEIASDRSSGLLYSIIIPPSEQEVTDGEEKLLELRDAQERDRLAACPTVYYANDAEAYDKISDQNINEYLVNRSWFYDWGSFVIDESYAITYEEWCGKRLSVETGAY